MYKVLNAVVTVSVLSVLLSGCTGHKHVKEETGRSSKMMKDDIALKPSGQYEECFSLEKGEVLVYRFRASKPLNFNVHYHAEKGVMYPVSENEITEYSGTVDPQKGGFNLDEQDSFCLMWENPDTRPVNLHYETVTKIK